MSEMIKNSDVEDVLFSIRRLVSDTPDEAPAEENATSEAENDGKVSTGALFLTSSLRVNDPATEPEQVDLEDMTSDFSHFRDAVTRDEVTVEEFPSLDEVFASKADDNPRRLHLSEVVSDATPQDAQDEYFEDEDTGQLDPPDDLSARKWSTDPDVDTLSEFATPEDTFGAEIEEDADPEVDIAEETIVEAEVEVEAEADVAEQWIEDATEEAEEAIAEVEDVEIQEEVSEELDTLQEEDTAEHEYSDDQMVSEDTSDETHVDDVENDDDSIAAAADGLADFDENVLDEDALRDMVTEIVREELSGELGERLTRNVRKLVRREIHRALMTREFD